jgi:F0F1-type ATP synthase assembly protein I
VDPRDDTPAAPPSADDPRLAIPEVLRTPVDHPSLRPKPRSASSTGLEDLGKALAIGIDFLATTAAGGALGYLIDYWQGWYPYGLLTGLALGFIAATARIIQRANREDRLARERKAGGRPG